MANPRILLLETSTQPALVAVAEGDRLLAVRRLDEARRHTRDLAPAVAELFAKRGWQPRDVQAVVVGRGPGSYTGLRVGLMSAKAFAYATGCALIGLETFAVLAAQAPPEAERLSILADAQQLNIYVQEFERGMPTTALRIQSWEDWLTTDRSARFVTGPGLRKWAAKLPAALKALESSLWDPRPESLLQLGLARYLRGERDDVYNIEPIYLRPSAAEEKWKTRHPN